MGTHEKRPGCPVPSTGTPDLPIKRFFPFIMKSFPAIKTVLPGDWEALSVDWDGSSVDWEVLSVGCDGSSVDWDILSDSWDELSVEWETRACNFSSHKRDKERPKKPSKPLKTGFEAPEPPINTKKPRFLQKLFYSKMVKK